MAEGVRSVEAGGPVGSRPATAHHRRRTARREATRQRVLDAAREVFAERGVIGGTVEDICERAGFTRGAFYSNFVDKDDVVRALIAHEQERFVAHVDAALAMLEESLAAERVAAGAGAGGPAAADPVATMADVLDRLLAVVPGDRQFVLIQAELEIHAVSVPEMSRVFLEADAAFRGRIAEYLERGVRLLGRELVVDVADVTDAILAVVGRSTRRALLAGDRSDPDALARVILPVLVGAVSRPVGG